MAVALHVAAIGLSVFSTSSLSARSTGFGLWTSTLLLTAEIQPTQGLPRIFVILVDNPKSPRIFMRPDMKAIAGFNFPDNTSRKSCALIVVVAVGLGLLPSCIAQDPSSTAMK